MLGGQRLFAVTMALEDGADVFAVDPLHGDEIFFVAVRELVEAGDVLVTQRRRHFGLVHQHLDELAVGRQMPEHALDSDEMGPSGAVECLGSIDLGHPAKGDAVEELISA